MNKLNVKYETRKNEIYHFYSHFKSLDVDSIEDANDHIVDIDLKKENFENPLEEFYNTIKYVAVSSKTGDGFEELLEKGKTVNRIWLRQ